MFVQLLQPGSHSVIHQLTQLGIVQILRIHPKVMISYFFG